MAKKKKIREVIHLVCRESGHQNYTMKKKRGETKLEISKFCPTCRKHTTHTEKRK